MLTHEMAHNIVMETMKTLGKNINIMDKNGYILSSGDKERIGSFHEASKKVLESEKIIIVQSENKNKWRGSEPGINLPIKFQDKIIGVVGITGEPEEVKDFGASVVMMTELMIEHIYLMSQSEWKQRTQEFLLEGIFSSHLNEKKLEQQCKLLNIDLKPPYNIFIYRLQHHRKPDSGFRIIYDVIERILLTERCVYGFLDIETFVVLFTEETKNQHKIKDRLLKHLSKYYKYVQLGISNETYILNELSRFYKDLVTIMRNSQESQILMSDYEVERLLFNISKKEREEYKHRILNPINDDLKKTMIVFFDNDLNISKAANHLFIHRNTLIYRLDRIHEQTGYNPRKLNDALILQIACKVI